MNLNSSPSPFPIQQIGHDNDHQHHQLFSPNKPSSSSVSCHIFFNSTQDHIGYYDHHQLYQHQHKPDDNYAYHGGSTYEIKNKAENGLKLTLWKKEDDGHEKISNNNNPVKWMSSKMRLMQKMKNNPDRVSGLNITTTKYTEDYQNIHHPLSSNSMETDNLSSNSSSNHNNNCSPIRVCSDCNTTKTPLWRSGPKGPKSLCNACGIRQRKARRAMAAAAAAANGMAADQPPLVKIKVQHKEKIGKNGHHHASQLKKRCKTTAAAVANTFGSPPSSGQKKLCFEDFLINLSNNLTFHRVFPQDEKDAAILLMALSSGLVHG